MNRLHDQVQGSKIGHDITVYIDPDGSVTFTDLPGDILDVLHSLSEGSDNVSE